MTRKKYTIKDIAKLAGVSKGTVDRVLHNRGKVSIQAHEKVDRILQEIEYQPNPMARNLKENKIYRICVLIPDIEKDPYWIPAHKGICEAANKFKPFGVLVEEYYYDLYHKQTFIDKSEEAMASNPDVLLMAPLFQEESSLILCRCKEANVRVALFNNYVNTLNGEVFIGQDLYQSGKIAGGLINKMVVTEASIAIAHINKEPHMELKEKGFQSYFKDEKKSCSLLETQNFNSSDNIAFEKEVSLFLRQNPNIAALFVTNSKAHELVGVLERNDYKTIVVGYDLLEENIEYLKSGKIDFLIHQKPKRQAYLGVAYFAEFFLFGKKVPQQKLLPIDIITSENVEYYLG